MKFVSWINRNYIRKKQDLNEKYGKDSWIWVTGATAGIGLAICKYAASDQNMNVVLVGRNKEKLVAAEKEVKEANPKVKTKIYRFDFNDSVEIEAYQKLSDDLKDLDISMFVSNAGVMHCNPFLDEKENSQTLELIKEMVETNVFGPSWLTKIFMNRFQKRSQRSAMIIVASVAGYTPMPYNQHYAGTKAFLKSLSNAVGFENNNKVDTLAFWPGFVTTQLNGFHEGFDAATPKDCARTIFRDIGYENEMQPLAIQEFSLLIGHTVEYFSQGLALIGLEPMLMGEHKQILESRKSK